MKIKNFLKSVARFGRDENGATAIEYGIIVGVISIVIVVAAGTIGDNLTTTFDSIATALTPDAAD